MSSSWRRIVVAVALVLGAESTARAQRVPPPDEEAARRAEEVGPEPDPGVEAARAIWVSGDIGFTRADLGLLHDRLDLDRTGANGVLYGLSGGVRLGAWRFGLRWRVHDTTQFTLWSVGAQVGYALRMRPITPIFSAHLGYVFDQDLQRSLFASSLPAGTFVPPDVDVKGALLGIDANAAYAVTRWLRLGAFVGIDAMALFRAHAPAPRSIYGNVDTSGIPLYADTGFGLGLNVNAGFRGSFDIGFR